MTQTSQGSPGWSGPTVYRTTRLKAQETGVGCVVVLRSLHGFAVRGNRMALSLAGIHYTTPDPDGGRILRDASGNPSGVLIDRATNLLTAAIPETTDDFARFEPSGIIAAMQPPHCVEDMSWAEDRLGTERVKGAYAWRTLRKAGVPLTFSADLAGSDHNIFYGLHAAITRRDKQLLPPGGWNPKRR